MHKDVRLIRECIRNGAKGWTFFVDKYSPLIYGYIRSVSRRKEIFLSDQAIDELFHDVFLSLIQDNCRKLKSYRAKNGCSLATWLRQVTINFTIDYIRKTKPLVSLHAGDTPSASLNEFLGAPGILVSEHLCLQEQLLHLAKCVGKLRRQEKYFLELHFYRGLNIEKLRKHFRQPRTLVDVRKSRIIHKLRECFRLRGYI